MNLELSPQEYEAVLRRDFYTFVQRSFAELNPATEFAHNWHIEVIAHELELCRRGETKRLIINLPPRSLKSHCASVAFVAWLLGHNPSAQIICASYAQDLADKHAIDTRALMGSAFYQTTFSTRLSPEKRAVADFLTTARGCRKATSIGGVLTGRGADFIVIDDPLQPDKALSDTRRRAVNDWYDNTLVSRLNHKLKGCIIIVMQRLHEDDLVGHVLDIEQRQGIEIEPKWKVIRFPAIADEDERYQVERWFGAANYGRRKGEILHPAREPREILDQLRETQGEYTFAGQYQQSPAPMGGGMVKLRWFKSYTPESRPAKFDLIVQSWDTANKATELSDYSVCTTWGVIRTPCAGSPTAAEVAAGGVWGSGGRSLAAHSGSNGEGGSRAEPGSGWTSGDRNGNRFYLLDVARARLEYPELKRQVRAQAAQWEASNVLIEDKASGTQLCQELIREGMHQITKCESKQEKRMRMNSVTSTIENGFVYLPEHAPWLAAYLHELVTFPNGKHDDQADSTSQALNWLKCPIPHSGILEYYRQEYLKSQDPAYQREQMVRTLRNGGEWPPRW